jgi:hypothetical protein
MPGEPKKRVIMTPLRAYENKNGENRNRKRNAPPRIRGVWPFLRFFRRNQGFFRHFMKMFKKNADP